MNEVDLWDQLATGSSGARDKLILYYQPLVERLATKLARELPASVDVNDLISDGTLGLIDAIGKFEPGRGFKFSTYAPRRITGAMYDGLRRMDWVPRSVRAQLRMIQAATTELTLNLTRVPTDEEVADHLGWDLDQVRSALENRRAQGVAALDEPVRSAEGENDESLALADILSDGTNGPVSEHEMNALRTRLASVLGSLTERETTVLTLFYFEHLKFAEIGGILGVSESWVCQIHMNAIESLRTALMEEA